MNLKDRLKFFLVAANSWQTKYTELEYLESTGTQYIDTGIVPASFNCDIETVFAFSELNSGNTPACVWGYMGSSTLPRWLLASYQSRYLLNANATAAFGSQDTSKHTFLGKVYLDAGSVSRWSATVDGTTVLNDQALPSESAFLSNTLSIFLFARHNYNGAGNFVSGKLYRYTVKKAGVVIQDFIPVKCKSNNTLGMYDLVSGAFLTNQGTGTFIGGDPI